MRVVAVILCIVVLAICSLGMHRGGVPVPVYPSVSYNVAGATEATYRDFIGALREIVTRRTRTWTTPADPKHGLPVLNPEAQVKDGDRFVLVHLINGGTVTLAIDVTNLYVVAFSGANNKSYFFKDFTPLQRNNLFTNTSQTLLGFTSNYKDIENQPEATPPKKKDQPGVGKRGSLPLGPTPLADAITRLWYGGSVADPLLVVIQMVSEAARFRRIEEQVRKSIIDRNTFTPKGSILSMENEWGNMSKEVQLSKDGEHFVESVQLKDDNYKPFPVKDFGTLSRYTMVAILLHHGSDPSPPKRHH